MYTAALHGSYTGELPPPSSVYTKVISAILNNESLKPYANKHSELVNYILTVYGEKTIVNKPLSSLTLILSTKVFPERFKTIKYNGEVLIIEDVIENKQNIVVLDNPLERLWAMIINDTKYITINGVPPLQFQSVYGYLKNYTIHGSTVQNGTPTPDNPVEVHAVGDRTGNLLRFTDTNSINAGGAVISQTADKSEIVIVSRTATETDSSAVINVAAKLAAGTYTLSVEGLINHGVRTLDRIYIRDKDKNVMVNNVQTDKPRQFTISEDAEITGLSIVFADVSEYSNQVVRVMLNEGSTPLPYEPYGYKIPITTESEDDTKSITTPIYLEKPLYKIGDYADSINYAEQKAERVVEKTRLMNPISVETVGDLGYRVRFSISAKPAVSYTQSQGAFCNIAKYNSNYANIGFVPSGNIIYITQNISEWATTEGATEWFENHEVYVCYILAEPETEFVELPKIPTLDGTTVIDVETGVKPSNISIEYSAFSERIKTFKS